MEGSIKPAIASVLPAFLLLCGCVSTGPDGENQAKEFESTGIEIVGLEIHNSLDATVYDVMVLVPATGGFVSCGQVLAHTSCSTTFPHTEYRGYPVKVSWRGRLGETAETKEQHLDLDADLKPGMSAVVRVVLLSEGLAATLLEPTPLATAPQSR